ncbi:MAG: V-type synthase subunit [Caloramator sp.]|nr:V-type synthase subunit [Caloramator sp.]
MHKEYLSLKKIEGPLIVVEGVEGVSYNEMVEIKVQGETKHGKVVQLNNDLAIVQVFENTSGMSVNNISVKFTGKPLEIKLSREILGRMFNGIGQPIDGGGASF